MRVRVWLWFVAVCVWSLLVRTGGLGLADAVHGCGNSTGWDEKGEKEKSPPSTRTAELSGVTGNAGPVSDRIGSWPLKVECTPHRMRLQPGLVLGC